MYTKICLNNYLKKTGASVLPLCHLKKEKQTYIGELELTMKGDPFLALSLSDSLVFGIQTHYLVRFFFPSSFSSSSSSLLLYPFYSFLLMSYESLFFFSRYNLLDNAPTPTTCVAHVFWPPAFTHFNIFTILFVSFTISLVFFRTITFHSFFSSFQKVNLTLDVVSLFASKTLLGIYIIIFCSVLH